MSDIDKILDEILVAFFNEAEPDVHKTNGGTVYTKAGTHAKRAIKQLIEEEVYTALVKELSQMLDGQIVKPEYHNLVVGKTVGYQASRLGDVTDINELNVLRYLK